ncbi:hypothetical protein FRC07_007296 [Ceratobasidium sp. 392]|nr:hypothetical protein FRC07_007296 [Ceratobasidium sp. 392]
MVNTRTATKAHHSKSAKAHGKARARRVPSPTPRLSLTPPPTGRRGRPQGAGTYSTAELKLLLKVVQHCQPRANSDWGRVETRYNAAVPADRGRQANNLRVRFHKLVRMPKPTGNPESNGLHEEAVMLNAELEGLEYTHVLDDSPPESRGSTIDLASSDSDMEVLDVPAPPPSHPRRAVAPQPKNKAKPSSAFRAVARKVGANSRPAQSQGFLDAATAQIASVFSPAAEERMAERQREDLTILSLNDTIRDLRAELSQERERRFALERELRDEQTRNMVASQVQQQLRQHLTTHGNAHPSSFPGPPPSRTDASGSGGA